MFANRDRQFLTGRSEDHARSSRIESVKQPQLTLTAIGRLPAKTLGLFVVTAGQQGTRLILR